MNCSPPGSSVHGTFQARILEWVAGRILEHWSAPPGDLPDPGIDPKSPAFPALAGGFLTAELPGKPPLTQNPQ